MSDLLSPCHIDYEKVHLKAIEALRKFAYPSRVKHLKKTIMLQHTQSIVMMQTNHVTFILVRKIFIPSLSQQLAEIEP